MKTKNFNLNHLLTSLFELLVGILLLIDPVGFTSGIIVVAGIILCILGIRSVIKYFRADAVLAAKSQSLLTGLALLLAGGFCIFKSRWFVATFPILTILYGVIMLLVGLSKVQITVDLLRLRGRRWYLAAISAALSLICAIIVLANPFGTTAVLWMFAGITLIAEAVMDIITAIFSQAIPEES